MLDTVRTQITNRKLGEDFSQYIENIKRTCNEVEDWLQTSHKTITVEELESKIIEVEVTLKNLWCGLKQEIQAIEAEKEEQAKKERKLTEARDNLIKYLNSIRQMCESEQIAGTEYPDRLNALHNETVKWLQSEEISAESIQAEHERLQATVQEIKQSISKMKQKKEAEAILRQKAFDDLCKYIDEVQTKIATEEKNDEFTSPHINMITKSCEIVLEWVKKHYTEEMFRQQARTAVHDYIDDVCNILEAERETDKTIVQCIDTIYKHCTNVFKWINENYHQIPDERILSEFDKLQKTVNDIFNALRARKKEVEAERERQREKTIRKQAEVINNLRAYISDVRSLVVFKQFNNRLTEVDLRLIFGQCDIAERHIKENSDMNQLEVQYSDLRKLTEHVYKKLERIDTIEQAELTRRPCEERRTKTEMRQKLKNYIDRVQRLTVFEPLTHRLTKNDKSRIQSKIIKANHVLIAENLTSTEIERNYKELDEIIQSIHKELKKRKEKETKEPQEKDKRVTPTKWIAVLCRVTKEIMENMKQVQLKMTISEKTRLQELCKDTEEWCENNSYAEERDVELKRRKLEELWNITLQKIETREINVDVERSRNPRYLLQPEDSKSALIKLALLARGKVHSHIYKTQIPDSDRNKIISKYNEVLKRAWTKEKAEIELMEFKQLCIKVFKTVDEKVDPQHMDIERRWYY
uniref:centrosomal protein of 112 kDa-like n=1 Tax=Styela clava TaxID=7725 RepID=UPI001939EBE8|nr:centrosomal protein of 112 kDa-like [Styela clava]